MGCFDESHDCSALLSCSIFHQTILLLWLSWFILLSHVLSLFYSTLFGFSVILGFYCFLCCMICLSRFCSITDVVSWFESMAQCSGITPIGQGWTNARGLRGLGGPKPDPKFFLYILIFQMLGVSHLFYSTDYS